MDVLIPTINDNGILTLTINRPDKLNALNENVLNELSNQFSMAQHNDDVRGIIITGQGKAFCAGADINRLAEANAQTGYAFAKSGQDVFNQLENVGKPSIAAINGYAFGGGCELAIAATMRICSEKALFGQPEVKLGVIPGYGGTQRLARLIGKGRALDLCLTGRSITAKEAYDFGLVSQICPPDELLNNAEKMLLQVLGQGPLATRAVMEVINKGYDMTLDDALHLEALHFAMCCSTSDKNEGVRAFLDKRQAQFEGN